MSCEKFREALSARVDGEVPPLPDSELDRHLAECAGCRAWFEEAHRLRRWMVVRAAAPVPDLSAQIVAAAPARRRCWHPVRIALTVVALAQCALAIAQLLGLAEGMDGMAHGMMVQHLTNEGAAWNLAIGIGLLWAALRTRAAAAQLPLLTGFVLVLGVVSAGDLLGGRVTVDRLASHLLVVVGVLLLYVVARRHRADHRPAPVVDTVDSVDGSGVRATPVAGPAEVRRDRGYGHRPAGRHRAA